MSSPATAPSPFTASSNNATPPRPPLSARSPSKRAFVSSPTSSPPIPQESPRVLRTRFSSDPEPLDQSIAPTTSSNKSNDAVANDAVMERGEETPPTPPSPGLVGLGVGLGEEQVLKELEKLAQSDSEQGLEQEQLDEGATQTQTAEEQVRRMQEMPVELHHQLARLCSQHYLSEYNTMKRLAQAPPPGPYPPPLRSLAIQRSHSSPPMNTTASPPTALPSSFATPISSAATAANSSHGSAPAYASTFSIRPHFGRATTATGPIFRPPLIIPPTPLSLSSRPSTPPHINLPTTTSLTPTLDKLAFDSDSPTPLNGPLIEQQRDISAELGEAIRTNLSRTVEQRLSAAAAQSTSTSSAPTPPLFRPLPPMPPVDPAQNNGLLPGMKVINGVAVKTSASHPMNISALVPPDLLTSLAPRLFTTLTKSSPTSSPTPKPPKSPLMPSSSINVLPLPNPFVLSPSYSPSSDLYTLSMSPPVSPYSIVNPLPPMAGSKRLGNFMLSSCPGKKVRMNGVKQPGGRSAICRDVEMDLKRAKDEGVGLVICCLDDQELAFLGAPWPEYIAAATSLGLSVIRLPMVEGFAPSSPSFLDVQLSRVIQNHTLKGESVLAHCRGGIGRAGLVACCWLLKMGLVGHDPFEQAEGQKDPIRAVERVIEVIRKRRSIKSIETPIQVAFLLSYATFLADEATTITSIDF